MSPAEYALTLEPRRVRNILFLAVAALAVLTLASRSVDHWAPGSATAHGLARFDAGLEASVGTLFTALLLLASAGLAVAATSADARLARRWRMLGLVLAVLALDEAIGLHELTIGPFRRLLDAGGVLYFTWVVPGIVVVIAIGVFFWPLVASLPRPQRRTFLVAAVLFFGASIGFELAEGWVFDRRGEESLALVPLTSVEETCEMVGVALLLYALMLHVAPWSGWLRVAVVPTPMAASPPQLARRHPRRLGE